MVTHSGVAGLDDEWEGYVVRVGSVYVLHNQRTYTLKLFSKLVPGMHE